MKPPPNLDRSAGSLPLPVWAQAVVPDPTFSLQGCQVARLALADAGELQDLYERCSDYHEAHEGVPTRPTAGEDELRALPPERTLDDKHAFGIYASDHRMVGYLELVRDYPAEYVWWIGLLMLDPKVRGHGLGTLTYRGARAWAAERGARRIQLGVLDGEHAAERFWKRQGFTEVRRAPYRSEAGGKRHTLVVLEDEITAGEP